jgi:hypothetical protein
MVKKMKSTKIRRELPPVGTVLKGKFKGNPYSARVVKDKSSPVGRAIKYDGNLYKSMTAAAEAITKQSVNGWRFWKF